MEISKTKKTSWGWGIKDPLARFIDHIFTITMDAIRLIAYILSVLAAILTIISATLFYISAKQEKETPSTSTTACTVQGKKKNINKIYKHLKFLVDLFVHERNFIFKKKNLRGYFFHTAHHVCRLYQESAELLTLERETIRQGRYQRRAPIIQSRGMKQFYVAKCLKLLLPVAKALPKELR